MSKNDGISSILGRTNRFLWNSVKKSLFSLLTYATLIGSIQPLYFQQGWSVENASIVPQKKLEDFRRFALPIITEAKALANQHTLDKTSSLPILSIAGCSVLELET